VPGATLKLSCAANICYIKQWLEQIENAAGRTMMPNCASPDAHMRPAGGCRANSTPAGRCRTLPGRAGSAAKRYQVIE
jgi:hypothetical protein